MDFGWEKDINPEPERIILDFFRRNFLLELFDGSNIEDNLRISGLDLWEINVNWYCNVPGFLLYFMS